GVHGRVDGAPGRGGARDPGGARECRGGDRCPARRRARGGDRAARGLRLPARGRAGRRGVLRWQARGGPRPDGRLPPRPAGGLADRTAGGVRAGRLRRRHRPGGAVTLTLDEVSHRYVTERGEVVHAVSDTSVTIPAGQFVCVVGPSGCGKTTLLKVLAGFLQPTGGGATMDGAPITAPSPERGVVFQHPN